WRDAWHPRITLHTLFKPLSYDSLEFFSRHRPDVERAQFRVRIGWRNALGQNQRLNTEHLGDFGPDCKPDRIPVDRSLRDKPLEPDTKQMVGQPHIEGRSPDWNVAELGLGRDIDFHRVRPDGRHNHSPPPCPPHWRIRARKALRRLIFDKADSV